MAGIRNGTGESDRCDRTLLGSGTGTYVSESDRCDRTLSGSRTSTAWLDFLLGWTSTAWQESGTELASRIDVIGLFLDPEQELMFQSLIDVIGLLVDPGPSTAWLDFLLGWTSTAWQESRTELASRIDVIGLFLDPEQELMFQSLIDVIGLLVDPGPSTAWLDFLLGWTSTAWQESGTELVSRIDVIGLFLDPEQELMFQSLIDVIGLLVDPGPSTAWLDFLLGWTSTAWQESGTELVSRIDVIGLFLDPEQELMFQSLIDVIGLLVDPGPRLLGWTFCLAGPRQLGRNQERNW